MSQQNNYVIATIKPWNIDGFERFSKDLPGKFHLIRSKDELNEQLIEKLNPRYIFFPHWSWIVPKEVLDSVECVCFHMTDVPYGRGGGPLQNLIARGHKDTKFTALRMVEELDAGPVYLKKDLSLEGRAQEVFERTVPLAYEMIRYIVENEPEPKPQEGEVVSFKRRTPDMSELPKTQDLNALYDHIRMLDAETYPHAYIDYGDYRIEFENADLKDDNSLEAKVTITLKERS